MRHCRRARPGERRSPPSSLCTPRSPFVILSGLNVRLVSAGGRTAEDLQHRASRRRRRRCRRRPARAATAGDEEAGRRRGEESRAVAGRRAADAELPVQSPIPAAKVAGTGSASSSGAAQRPAPGTGAGGSGQRPRRRRRFLALHAGAPDHQDPRPRISPARRDRASQSGSVGVTIRVNPDGSVVQLPRRALERRSLRRRR